MRYRKKIWTYLCIMAVACVCAVNYQLFVFPNRFAPAGLNGICTMIQYVYGIRLGYLSLVINVPLAVAAYFLVSRDVAKRSMTYVVTFSLMLLVLDRVDLSRYAYHTDNGTSTLMGPFVAGLIFGGCYSMLVRISAHSGGTDFVSALIHKWHPELNFFWVTFVINCVVAGISFFVYDYQIEPVLMCIVYCFTSSFTTDHLSKSGRSAVRVEIITREPDALAAELIRRLRHTATLVPGKGMYQGKPISILICIVNKSQVFAVTSIVRQFPGSFAVLSQVNEVFGNFKHLDKEGNDTLEIFDRGDGNLT